MERFEDLTCCLVCGFDFGQELSPDDDCPCCGNHIGFCSMPNISLNSIREYRQEWFDTGAIWGDGKTHQPKGWNKEMALEQIKKNVPKKFQ